MRLQDFEAIHPTRFLHCTALLTMDNHYKDSHPAENLRCDSGLCYANEGILGHFSLVLSQIARSDNRLSGYLGLFFDLLSVSDLIKKSMFFR